MWRSLARKGLHLQVSLCRCGIAHVKQTADAKDIRAEVLLSFVDRRTLPHIETFPIDKTKRYVDSINARTRREKPLPLSSSTVLV